MIEDQLTQISTSSKTATATISPQRTTRPGTILSSVRRDPFERITMYLRRLAKEQFYGIVSVTLRDGAVQVVRTEQTLRLSDIPNTPTPGDTATVLGTTTATTGGVA